MARPRKPLELLLIKGTFRKDRHACLLPTAPKPAVTRPEPEREIAYEDLPAKAKEWDFYLSTGISESFAQELLSEAQIKRVARRKWLEHGPLLVRCWGEKHSRESWAWRRWGEPEAG